ncbi:nitrogenase iron-molybdenum cofactor biosynthesis protein NifN [Oscillatoria salina]|uniref:nitrogenase iron-molybdenum cofactor biosynthesis protein NifN n=1 Tax=Oscillatoria salina TaxID=331517 RepID=UPI001CCF98FC|nr:nitrogenase iron-molybdenum cofactor biosynthesis protein NifN [Oscillatoria salina]MBZ8181685.1 nitrogenase iron-molybdenum cofactor biosynthesis protein NifN [Oscillatoria salina IIICB1]
MTTVTSRKKSVAVNPLKQSQPLGAALAFLGLKGTVPLFHGSQGCTAFAKVLLVRHFREAIPLATTAMTEVSTILGGEDNVEQAILTLVEKAKPEIIALFTTGLTETRGDDMKGILRTFRESHPELDSLPIVFVSTPDYKGAMQDGFAAAVREIVATDFGSRDESLVEMLPQVTILAGSLLSPGDVAEIKQIVQDFGLKPLILPDISGSLDGHLEDEYQTTTAGGTSLEQLRNLNQSTFTLAIGESMRSPAETLQQQFGTNYEVFPQLAGLEAVDKFLWRLSQIVNSRHDPHFIKPPTVPNKYEIQRRQLQDAILDTHFYFGRKRISLALEPDLLYQTAWLLHNMGAEIQAAVTTTKSPILSDLPVDSVTIGDLEDLEDLAAGSDLIIANSQAKSLAKKLHIPLYRLGYPIYDRLGNGYRFLISYRGTIQFLFDIGNIFIEQEESQNNH